MNKFLAVLFLFFILPFSVSAYDTCSWTGTTIDTMPCEFSGKTHDAWIKLNSGGSVFYYLFSTQYHDVRPYFESDTYEWIASSTNSDYNTFGSFFTETGGGGGESASYAWNTIELIDFYNVDNLFVSPFSLEYQLWGVSTSSVYTYTGCEASSTTTDCGILPAVPAIAVDFQSLSDDNDFEVEVTLSDFNGGELHGLDTFQKTVTNSTPLYSLDGTVSFVLPYGLDVYTYRLNVCVQYVVDDFDSDLFVHTGDYRLCKDMLVGNGMASSSHRTLLDGNKDIWVEYECDDIGILDVKKGVQCAFIWAFYPDTTALNKFSQVRNDILTVAPIGYGTFIIADFITAVNSTSTTAMNREINFGRWFGLSDKATTTIEFAPLVSSGLLENALFDWIDFVLWFIFYIWILCYALTRKL